MVLLRVISYKKYKYSPLPAKRCYERLWNKKSSELGSELKGGKCYEVTPLFKVVPSGSCLLAGNFY